ncbi:Acetylornithine/succinyldiaminopimelate aminotransferase [Candidatus Johnevansia muelleri]|uniref:Acetylornithine aminotransferase n=1 Tax=Candidatus Johnevansia muelleri TaxID=1495769 RepID=A0A078KIA0_9GAMM|nr:Acetylornithine/succinyldiaminopimelate aminotransferase [Candidatus Evansia muelleri]
MNFIPQREDFDRYILHTYYPQYAIPIKGYGSILWDQHGKEYIDFSSGIAVNSLGHCNPALISILKNQSNKIWHISNVYTNEPAIQLANKIIYNTFADKVFFCSSGAEANEAAIKLARRYANNINKKKYQIISFIKSFHGRTFLTMSIGGQKKYSNGFGPLPNGIIHAEFNNLESIYQLINNNTCAVILEPIQGEGGVITANNDFLNGIRKLCDAYNALLIFDEVQCGMGRTGKLYSYMHYNIIPDILTSAKAIGGGFPLAAMLTTNNIADIFIVGNHGSTYGGNPLACALGNTSFEIISSIEIISCIQNLNDFFLQCINEINYEFNIFKDIRGIGLLIGVEIKEKYNKKVRNIIKETFNQGVMVIVAGGNSVLRFTPPLIIKLEEIEEGMIRFCNALNIINYN